MNAMQMLFVTAAIAAVPAIRTAGMERPVAKVVRLLQDMGAELEKERADDEAVYEQLACWCSTNEKEKTHAIEVGTAKMDNLKSDMEEFAAKIEELREGLASTRDKLQADQKALNEATELRAKENKVFHEEETSLLDAISSCKNALVVLSKHNPSLEQIRSVYKNLQALKAVRMPKALTSESMDALHAFIQQEGSLLQQKSGIPGMQSYAPQSGQIFGVLRQMQEDFEGDLATAQKEEQRKAEEFAELRDAKKAELEAGQKQLQQLENDDADFREKNAEAYEEYNDTREQLELDQEFMRKLQKRCSMTDAEYEKRSADRLAEIVAVQETIAMLNNDASFDIFGKTVGTPNFLQVSSRGAEIVHRAREVLQKTGIPALVLLASKVQLASFTKVKEAIDKMVAELSKQQEEEVKHQDWCNTEIASNERSEAKEEDKKTNLETTIGDLEQTIEGLTKSIEDKKVENKEMQEQMRRASELREGEYGDFHQTVVDQSVTQAILQKAIDRMAQVYGFLQQQPGAPHIETSATHTDPGNGPARFDKYEKKASGGRVLNMLEEILGDSKKMADEAIAGEQDAQFTYENFMQDSNKALAANLRAITNMQDNKAKREQQLGLAKADHVATLKELENLNAILGDLHKSCDFVLQNFDARQEARSDEIKALREAKAILSGMESQSESQQ